MSGIDDLIQELCPDGVEHTGVLDIADYVRGITYSKNDEDSAGEIQVLRANNITLASNTLNFEDVKRVSSHVRVRDAQRLRAGDTLICAGSGSRDHIGKVAYIREDIGQTFGGFMAVLRTTDARVESRFLFHLLTGERFKTHLDRSLSTSTINNLNASVMRGFRVPIPPLEVQREIVRKLDQFTQLEAELEAELEARRTQYEYYRDKLVRGNWGRRSRLADLGTFVRGRRFTKSDIVEKGIPSLHYGEIYTDYGTSATRAVRHIRPELRENLRYAQPGSVVFAGVGETVEDVGKAVAWLGEEPIATHDDTFVFSSGLDPKYVAYAVQTADFHRQKERHVSRAKVKRLSAAGLGAIEIPVPSLEEQASIVRSLDKFDALVHDISIGLPAELAARRKQYEHCRDRLLTFKELTP